MLWTTEVYYWVCTVVLLIKPFLSIFQIFWFAALANKIQRHVLSKWEVAFKLLHGDYSNLPRLIWKQNPPKNPPKNPEQNQNKKQTKQTNKNKTQPNQAQGNITFSAIW